MRRVIMFAEDFGHEAVISALLARYENDFRVAITVNKYSVRGGHGHALSELKRYMRDLLQARESWPDLLVVAHDSNCRVVNACRSEVEDAVKDASIPRILAIPDPHIERWLLLDSAAFKSALGKGCNAPDQKCGRDRYKALLASAVRDAGVIPLIGGIEHAEEIIGAMNLQRMRQADKSLGKLLEELEHVFHEWSKP